MRSARNGGSFSSLGDCKRYPSCRITLHWRRAATASIRPEPQIPFTKSGSLPGPGITSNRMLPICLAIFTPAIAPGSPRIPCSICAPSNAGPAGAEQVVSLPWLLSAISAFVPISTASTLPGASMKFSKLITATASAPTCASIPAGTITCASLSRFMPSLLPWHRNIPRYAGQNGLPDNPDVSCPRRI